MSNVLERRRKAVYQGEALADALRWISIVLAVVLALGVIAAFANAANDDVDGAEKAIGGLVAFAAIGFWLMILNALGRALGLLSILVDVSVDSYELTLAEFDDDDDNIST